MFPQSPEYIAAQEIGETRDHPVVEVFKNHYKSLTAVVLSVVLHDLSFYILFVYMATYLSEVIGLAKNTALLINTANLLVVSCTTVAAAWLSDRVGRKLVLAVSAILFIVGTIPLLNIVNGTTDPRTILVAQMILAIAVGGYFGPIPALMVEAFPTSVRFSAIAITTNISGSVFGGTAPILVTYLIAKTGSTMIPAFYLTAGAVIALIALRFVKNHHSVTTTVQETSSTKAA